MHLPLLISHIVTTEDFHREGLFNGIIVSEGDTATAFCGSCLKEVTIRYEYLHFRSFKSESGDLMMGVCTECGKLISVPEQSSHLLMESFTERKEYPVELRLPRPLLDILRLVASCFNVSYDRFRSALLRYYSHELYMDDQLIVHVMRLARSDLARQRADARLTFRLTPEGFGGVCNVLTKHRITNCSMMMRGLILVAAEDVLTQRSNRRKEAVSAIAASIT